jgi:hypothetical protein
MINKSRPPLIFFPINKILVLQIILLFFWSIQIILLLIILNTFNKRGMLLFLSKEKKRGVLLINILNNKRKGERFDFWLVST